LNFVTKRGRVDDCSVRSAAEAVLLQRLQHADVQITPEIWVAAEAIATPGQRSSSVPHSQESCMTGARTYSCRLLLAIAGSVAAPAYAQFAPSEVLVGDPTASCLGLEFSPDMKWFVTAANRLNHVDLYRWQGAEAAEPLKLVKRIEAPKTPSHLSIDSKSTVVYVSLQDSDELMAIDLATQAPRWKIKVGKMPADLHLTADDRLLLVGLTGDKFVEVYDVSGPPGTPARLVKRIETGNGAHAFRAKGDKRHVFVSNRVANTISLIDTQSLTVVEQYPGPGGPDCMEMLADGKTLLVTSRWARKLTFIDLPSKKVVRQVDVGRSPHGV
jgi:DNA-binding beta-propeller fold protein YncE